MLAFCQLFLTSAFASDAVWFGSYLATPNTGAARFAALSGAQATLHSIEANAVVVIPTALTIKSLNVEVNVAPDNGGGTDSWTITIRTGSTAAPTTMANTAATCVIEDLETACTPAFSGSVAVDAGVLASISITPANTPAATNITWTIVYEATTSGETVIFGNTNSTDLSAAATQYIGPFAAGPAAAEPAAWFVIPGSFTAQKLCVYLVVTPGSGDSRTFTGYKNSATTSQPAVVFDEDDVGIECDNTTSNAVQAGDTYSLQSTLTGTPATSDLSWGIVLTAATPGQFVIAANSATSLNTGAATYVSLSGPLNSTTADSTVPTLQNLADSGFTITHARAKLSAAPNTGNNYVGVLREDAADASSPFTITIADAATTGSADGTYTSSASKLLNSQWTPNSTPDAAIVAISYLGSTASSAPVSTNGCKRLLLLGVGGGC